MNVNVEKFTEDDLVFIWEAPITAFDSAEDINNELQKWYCAMSDKDAAVHTRPFYRAVYRNPSRSSWVVASAYRAEEGMDTFLANRFRKNTLRTARFNWEIKFQCIMAGDQYSFECKYLRDSIDVLENYYNLEEDARLMSIRGNLHYLAVNRR